MPANAAQQEPVQRETTPEAVDVHALLEKLTPHALSGGVTVRGIVKNIHYFPDRKKPTRVFGDLLDQNQRSAISFSCHPSSAPELTGEPVVLQGRLQITTSGIHPGFKVQIVGDSIGRWTPLVSTPVAPFLVPSERTRTSLAELIERNPAKRLVVLGTNTAIDDVVTQVGEAVPRFATQDVSTNLVTLQNAVNAAASSYDALCLVRGGGDPGSFATFNDPELVKTLLTTGLPFYVAVGHATDLTLVDKYADQSFPTPTAFGTAYLHACEARDRARGVQQRLHEAELEVKKLKAERGSLYKEARQQQLDKNVTILSELAAALTHLPETVGRQVSSAVTSAVRDSLPQLLPSPPRVHTAFWPSVACSFLLGAVLGALALNHFEAGRLSAPQAQRSATQQQIKPAPMLPKPSPRRPLH